MSDQQPTSSNTSDLKHNKKDESLGTKKVIRVLTVIAYLSSVSMAAIMLSLYYIFLWNPKVPTYSPLQSYPPDEMLKAYFQNGSLVQPMEEPRALPVRLAAPNVVEEREMSQIYSSNYINGQQRENQMKLTDAFNFNNKRRFRRKRRVGL